jgi:hypothetical protein
MLRRETCGGELRSSLPRVWNRTPIRPMRIMSRFSMLGPVPRLAATLVRSLDLRLHEIVTGGTGGPS